MLILPRNIQAPCLLRRGMPTIFLHLGKFQPAKWGIFNRRKLGNIQPALTFKPHLPLSFIDPGLDPYTGSVIWVEAHYQNPARFRPSEEAPRSNVLVN